MSPKWKINKLFTLNIRICQLKVFQSKDYISSISRAIQFTFKKLALNFVNLAVYSVKNTTT